MSQEIEENCSASQDEGLIGFVTHTIRSVDELLAWLTGTTRSVRQFYRGQEHDWPLRPSLERWVNAWGYPLNESLALESELVREFRRRLRGDEHAFVQDDLLNCLALIRHHGGPTRLLDCTYSPFVAAQTALRGIPENKKVPVIWRFDGGWIDTHCRRAIGKASDDLEKEGRGRIRFRVLSAQEPTVVVHDNPYFLNQRLTLQQGLFLCPGNISKPFFENVKSMTGWDSDANILKVRLKFSIDERRKAIPMLKRMNVSSAVLFPGLDGFASSLGEELPHYRDIYLR
jgi:hypothetical protein